MPIRRDNSGLIIQHSRHNPDDTFHWNGDDSSRSTGMMATFGYGIDQGLIKLHCTKKGFVRNPNKENWADPLDFSRDQALCLMSGFYYSGDHRIVRREFYRRFYFLGKCPNWDLLGLEFYWHMILCGKIYELYWLAPVGYLAQILHIWYMTKEVPREEQNQTICIAKRSGLLKLWAKWHYNWKQSLHDYWSGWRDQKEIAEFLIKEIEREIS